MNDARPEATPSPDRFKRTWALLQWLASVLLVLGTLAWLLFGPHPSDEPHATAPTTPPAVEAIGPNQISIDMSAAIGKKIHVVTVESQVITEPLMQVTGGIIACRRPGKGSDVDYWQFSSSDLLTTYTDREKAVADVDFATTQLSQIKDLAETKEQALQREIERSEKLVKSGSEAARDLAIQKTSLMETRINNKKDIYQAETAIKTARRNLTALNIQLQQAGLDPEMLHNATPDMDIVAAEVPEGRIGSVSLGQSCTARFFGLPRSEFSGKVVALSPVLSSEQRTLRVLFLLHDPQDELRPGMFAEIGIGSDPRPVVRVSADSVVHVGRVDYVLIATDKQPSQASGTSANSNRLQLTAQPVQLTESVTGSVEVVKGLVAGDRIADGSVILLKPALVNSLQDRWKRTAASSQTGAGQ